MRILVTGAAGFGGRHACRELSEHGHIVVGADRAAAPQDVTGIAEWFALDVGNADACKDVLAQARPDACLHLAGIAFVPNAEASAETVFQVNTLGTLHMLDAAAAVASNMRVLVVTTSEVYGDDGKAPDPAPLREDAPLAPRNLYGISKAAADQCALLYARTKNMGVMTARPSNHTGPGQRPPFVVPAFVERLLSLRGKGGGSMQVGNLDSERRFLDVRDVVRAYRLILEKGLAGEAYNISTSISSRIGDVLALLAAKLQIRVETEVDPALYRPTNKTAALDLTKIYDHCGWMPQYDLSATLDAMLGEMTSAS